MKHLCTYFVSMVLLLLLLSSCRTGCSLADSQLPEIIYHDTVRVHSERQDSIFIHDSIHIHTVGDTIYSTRFHTTYRYRIAYRDSITHQRDSVPYPVIVEKPVPYTPKWKNCLAIAGALSITFILLYFAVLLLRK